MTSPSRDRSALGRGVRTLIPAAPATASPGEAATAALASLRTVPVQAGVLQAAAVLLDTLTQAEDQGLREAAASTRDHLLTALGTDPHTP